MLELAHKKIIVTFLMHLGDLVLTTPFLHVLRHAAPGAEITYLVDQKLRDVVAFNPNIDHVWTIDKKGKDDNLKSLLAMSRRISDAHFDILINLHPNERCSFIDAMAHVPVKVGASHFLFRPFFHPFLKLNRTIHAADMYLDVLKRLGVTDLSHQGLELYPGPEHREQADNFWKEAGITENDRLVGFNIGSAVETKRWSPERFAEVADTLAGEGYRTVFFGGTMDLAMVKEATDHMHTVPIIATGRFSIGALAAAMGRCSLIITNDSGPMHVAISQKVPIVAMYGPSHPDLYGPYTREAIIVRAEPPCEGCRKGMKHHCEDMRCMNDLKVEQVLAAAHKFLNRS
jgi:heptosyltransferase-2